MAVFDPEREELFTIKDDPMPPGMKNVGMSSKTDLTAGAIGHPLIRWRDQVMEADVYAMPGEPMKVHIVCPKCHTFSWVKQEAKAMSYEPGRGDPRNGGELNIEKFKCMGDNVEGRRRDFGLGMCNWRVAIDKNIARDI